MAHPSGPGGCPAAFLQWLQGDGEEEAPCPVDPYLHLPLLSVFFSNILTHKEGL